MITIKNKKELRKLLDENKDLKLTDDITVLFDPTGEIRNIVACGDFWFKYPWLS